ncbi:MAG TPA: dienelactone hydrolase family protein [Candidatus Dormibacteraeota bacterium]|jgi:carboxymethylenebutenolidase
MLEPLQAETVTIWGHGADPIPAYLARPLGAGPYPGVVVIHHMPGWDEGTREIVRRFAAHGYIAICPNLHHRDAPGAAPDDASAAARANGGVPDERFLGDCEGALRYLRAMPSGSGRVATIGYCSGGRQSFLAACELDPDAAVVCYGAFIVGIPPAGSRVVPVIDRAEGISCPILGLFGVEDSHPSVDQVTEIDAELTRLGKLHEFHVYENAGHAFFAVDRPSYRPEAAVEGWGRIWGFLQRSLQPAGDSGATRGD